MLFILEEITQIVQQKFDTALSFVIKFVIKIKIHLRKQLI